MLDGRRPEARVEDHPRGLALRNGSEVLGLREERRIVRDDGADADEHGVRVGAQPVNAREVLGSREAVRAAPREGELPVEAHGRVEVDLHGRGDGAAGLEPLGTEDPGPGRKPLIAWPCDLP